MKLIITRKYFLVEEWNPRPESSKDIWITKEGKNIPIKHMSNSHLGNSINFIKRQFEQNRISAANAIKIIKVLKAEYDWRVKEGVIKTL